MAQIPMQLASVVWDDKAGTITLTFAASDQPPPPANLPEGAQWYPGAGSQLVMTAPVRKLAETPATGYALRAEGGKVTYREFEYVNGSWRQVK